MMVFEKIDDVYDAIMLGLTHDTLMVIGWRRIQSLLAQERSPWAGCRIICIGSSGNDLPDGLMSEEEQEEYLKLAGESDQSELFCLYDISERIATNPDSWVKREPLGLFSRERRVLRKIIGAVDGGYYWDEGWVLMNLSRKEYVESMAAVKILHSMDATDARCFGQLVFSKICWTSNDSCVMTFHGGLNRGEWAGNRFRIVTTNVFESKTTGEQWEDVTQSTVEWLRDILKSEDEYQNLNGRFYWADEGSNEDWENEDSQNEDSENGDSENEDSENEDSENEDSENEDSEDP